MEITAAAIRALVNRPASDAPVTSVYLNTDGARFPSPADYETRLDNLLRDVRRSAESFPQAHKEAVLADTAAIARWVRDEFERDGVRGVGVFASQGKLFERVQSALGVRNVARVNDRPYVVPLEVLLGRSHHIALVVIERDQARILRYQLGKLWVYQGLASDVHGQHDQGGWSQARFQRNIEHEVLHHMKDTSEVLRRLHDDQRIDALIIAGPHAEAAELNRRLHPYLQEVVHGGPMSLPLHAGVTDLLERLEAVEQELVSTRRADLLQRLAAARGQAETAARGVAAVLEAVNGKRVDTLFVVEGAGVPGWRSANGIITLDRDEAAAYGEPVEPVPDVLDDIIDEAVRSNAHVELFRDPVRLDGDPVAALLRF